MLVAMTMMKPTASTTAAPSSTTTMTTASSTTTTTTSTTTTIPPTTTEAALTTGAPDGGEPADPDVEKLGPVCPNSYRYIKCDRPGGTLRVEEVFYGRVGNS